MSKEDMEQILKEASKMIDEELQTNGVSFGKEAFAFIKNKFGLEQDYSVWRTIKTDEFIDFAEKEVNEMSDKLISLNAVIAAINEGFLTRAELRRKIMLISPIEQPMSTVEYAHHHGRLCSKAHIFCNDCPIHSKLILLYKADYDCVEFERDYPEEAVAIVEKWAREHPEERSEK